MSSNVDDFSQKQKSLAEILRTLDSSDYNAEKDQAEIIMQLEAIYDGKFRHSYSEIFQVVSESLRQNGRREETLLIKNLNILMESLKPSLKKDPRSKERKFALSIFKLCDHVNLEMARFQYLTDGPVYDIENLRRKSMQTERKIQQVLEESEKQAQKVHGESIAILAIFAAVVVAFSGGFNHITSAISAMKSSEVGHVVMIVTLAALALANTLFLMLYYVGKIIDKSLKGLYIVLLNLFLLSLPALYLAYKCLYTWAQK